MSHLEIELEYQGKAIVQTETIGVACERAEKKVTNWARDAAAAIGWTRDEEKAIARDELARAEQGIDRWDGLMCLTTSSLCYVVLAVFGCLLAVTIIIWNDIPIFMAIVMVLELITLFIFGCGISTTRTFRGKWDGLSPLAFRRMLFALLVALVLLFSTIFTLKFGYHRVNSSIHVRNLFVAIIVFMAITMTLTIFMKFVSGHYDLKSKNVAQAKVRREAADKAHAAANDAVAAVDSAVTAMKSWYQTANQALNQPRTVSDAVKAKNQVLPKMIDAIHAWTGARAMCQSVAEVTNPSEVTKLLIEVSSTVSEAKTISMEAEKLFQLYRSPDTKMKYDYEEATETTSLL